MKKIVYFLLFALCLPIGIFAQSVDDDLYFVPVSYTHLDVYKRQPENSAIYASLPEGVARQLTLDRDPHGNVQVSLIETEKLLSDMVATKLAAWRCV